MTEPISPIVASRLAHEVRSPLNVLAGTLDQLARDEGLSPTSAQLLELARRSRVRLERLSRRLSNIAAQRPEDRGPVPLEASRGWIERAAKEASRTSIEVVIGELPETNSLEGPVPHALEVALDEVVHNAVRHASKRVTITFELADNTLRVTVEDDGKGLPPSLVEATPDFDTTSRGGLGMGLRLAHDFLQVAEGQLLIRAHAVCVEVPTR